MKVIADKKYHEILGIHIIGPVAAEMINEAATIMESELTVDDVAASIHGHPTFQKLCMKPSLMFLVLRSTTHQNGNNIMNQKKVRLAFK